MKTKRILCITLILLTVGYKTGLSATTRARINPGVTREVALQKALNEVHRRNYVLPVGCETEVVELFHTPEIGAAIPFFSVTFQAGHGARRVMLYLVMVNRTTGEIDSVDNFLSIVDSMPPSLTRNRPALPVTSENAVRAAISEVRKRSLILPAGYRTNVVKSLIAPKVGPNKHVFFVNVMSGEGERSKRLYQVAINRRNGEVEFVFDFLGRTLE